jgi:hypothetical protein
MLAIHGYLPGGTQFVAEVREIPRIAREFMPLRILSTKYPDYAIEIQDPIHRDLENRSFMVMQDQTAVPWGETQIPSFELRVIQ